MNNRIHFINLIRDKETFYLCFEVGSWVVELETKIERHSVFQEKPTHRKMMSQETV